MSRPARLLHTLAAALAALAGTLPTDAGACGAFYAREIEVAAEQEIVVVHRDGTETYIFRPAFCGATGDFGLILPIPSTLRGAPTLADGALFDQIDAFTKPQEVQICERKGLGCGALAARADGAHLKDGFGTGVDVVDRGRVGIFEYALLQAVSVRAFTDWLDQNGFPHDASSTSAYEYYVNKQWYFVAFKVSADASAPPEGKKLCGVLGPIQVTFDSPNPVVPARIASVNAPTGFGPPLTWRVFLISAAQQRLDPTSTFYSTPYFSKALHSAELADFGALAALSRDGERLTGLTIQFPNQAPSDLDFLDDPYPADYRAVNETPVDCDGGCASGGLMPADSVGGAMLLGLLLLLQRAARRGTRAG